MKKTLLKMIIAFLSISMIISVCGCADSENKMKKYTAYAVGASVYDGGEGTDGFSTVIRFYNNYYGENDIIPDPEEKTKTITFLGKEYTGELSRATPRRLGGVDYEYITSEGDSFTVTSSGTLVKVIPRTLLRTHPTYERSITGEEAVNVYNRLCEIAAKWAKDLYGDNFDYGFNILVGSHAGSDENPVFYGNNAFVYVRTAYTPDLDLPYRFRPGELTFEISLDDYELLWYEASATIGKLKGKTVPADFTLDTVRNIIKDLVKDKNTSIELQCDIDDTVSKQFDVFPLDDGRLVCRTYAYVNRNTEYRLEIVIPLE